MAVRVDLRRRSERVELMDTEPVGIEDLRETLRDLEPIKPRW